MKKIEDVLKTSGEVVAVAQELEMPIESLLEFLEEETNEIMTAFQLLAKNHGSIISKFYSKLGRSDLTDTLATLLNAKIPPPYFNSEKIRSQNSNFENKQFCDEFRNSIKLLAVKHPKVILGFLYIAIDSDGPHLMDLLGGCFQFYCDPQQIDSST